MAIPSAQLRQESRAICFLIASIGFGMAGVSMAINARYGARMSVDEDGKLLNGVLLLLLSMGPAALAYYSGRLSSWGLGGRAKVAFIAAVLLVTYSIWNANDFLSDQMLGKVKAIERKLESSKENSETTNAETLRSRQRTEDKLWDAHKAAKTPAEKAELLERIDKLRNEPLKLVAPPMDTTLVDNRSSWLSKKTGIDRETIQSVSPTVGAILMAIVELLFPWLGSATMPNDRGGQPARKPRSWWRFWGRNNSQSSETFRQFSKDEARQHFLAMAAAGKEFSSNKEAAEVWNVSYPQASKYLKAFRKEGLLRREQRGKSKAVVAAPTYANGNGRVVGNA